MLRATGRIEIIIIKRTSCFMCLLGIFMPPVASIAMPATSVKSAMLLPIMLPILSKGLLLSADAMPTNNSGKLVDTASIVNPVINALNRKKIEIFIIDFSNNIPDIASPVQEIKNKNSVISNCISFFLILVYL